MHHEKIQLIRPTQEAALECGSRGWHVFPGRIKDGSKRSFVAGKANGGPRWGATTDADTIRDYWEQFPNALLGITTGPDSGFFVIDADTPEGHAKDGVGTLRQWIEEHGDLPHTIEATTPSGGWHVYFKWPDDLEVRNSESKLAPGIDVRGEGGMVLAPPTIKPGTDKAYRWKHPPSIFELADCPEWLMNKIREAQAPKLSERAKVSAPTIDLGPGVWGERALQGELAVLLAAPEGTRNSSLNSAAFKLGQIVAFGSLDETTVKARLSAAAEAIGLEPSEIAATIESGFQKGTQTPRGPKEQATGGAQEQATRSFEELMEAAKALQPEQIEDMEAIVAETVVLGPVRGDAIFRAIKNATGVPLGTIRAQLSQERDAIPEPDHLDLTRMTLDEIGRANVICADAFVWRWQDRGVWTQQDDRAIKQAVQARLDREDMIDVTAPLVNGVTDVFKSDIFLPEHQFNLGNPETVNCLNGELELDDFGGWHLEPHCREHYRTTQIPVEYDPQADAPMFQAFLNQVFRDDPDRDDKIKAVLELMGYTLMSHARHERFVMLIGPGANGKSVLLAVLEGLLGSENVAGVQPANFDRSFQRAHLHQKLANIVTELKQGEVIADAELKAITSGEPATVEQKFKNPFVMRPFATCWFGTNHMPHTRDFSEALFRRATILQFNRTFAKSEQDPQLKDKLQTELPGILNMCLEAYARAVGDGFTEPASSEQAKQEWRLEADQVALFVEEKCHADPNARETMHDMFLNYQVWASNNGISKTMSKKGLRDRLTRLGFGAAKSGGHRYVTGLKVEN
jgi:putative DNA primase/helicase